VQWLGKVLKHEPFTTTFKTTKMPAPEARVCSPDAGRRFHFRLPLHMYVQVLSVVIAAVIHDVGHPGVNNIFLVSRVSA
jgi:hypothetical protein